MRCAPPSISPSCLPGSFSTQVCQEGHGHLVQYVIAWPRSTGYFLEANRSSKTPSQHACASLNHPTQSIIALRLPKQVSVAVTSAASGQLMFQPWYATHNWHDITHDKWLMMDPGLIASEDDTSSELRHSIGQMDFPPCLWNTLLPTQDTAQVGICLQSVLQCIEQPSCTKPSSEARKACTKRHFNRSKARISMNESWVQMKSIVETADKAASWVCVSVQFHGTNKNSKAPPLAMSPNSLWPQLYHLTSLHCTDYLMLSHLRVAGVTLGSHKLKLWQKFLWFNKCRDQWWPNFCASPERKNWRTHYQL